MNDVFENGRKYKSNVYYKYTLTEVNYSSGKLPGYAMYNDKGVWMSYVSKDFIKKNFLEYSEYMDEWIEVDGLFDKLLYDSVYK